MGWSIKTPNGIKPATIDESGNASFNANNTNDDITYTVYYTDEEKRVKCEIDVIQAANPCSFIYTKNEANIPDTGSTNYVFGTFENLGTGENRQNITVIVTAGSQYLNGTITASGDKLVGNVKPNNESGTREISYQVLADGINCANKTYTNTQDESDCKCSEVTKVNNENDEPFYTYTLSAHNHVPFAILTTSKAFQYTVTANSSMISEIYCTEYVYNDWTSADFNALCTRLSKTKKVWIIYGNLPEADRSTALPFTYSVCGNVCYDETQVVNDTPFYVFQRCACGMDNCKTEYPVDGGNVVIEDRPLYINSCGTDWCLNNSDAGCPESEEHWGWIQGDSICVEYLEFSGATKYLIEHSESNPNDTGTVRSMGRVDNLGGSKLTLCQGFVDAAKGDLRVKLNPEYRCSYSENHTKQNNYSAVDPVTGGHLITVDAGHNNTFGGNVADFYMYTIRTGDGSYHPYENAYGKNLPLNAMCQYMVNASPIEPHGGKITEQMWELMFTTTSEKIIGGPDHNKCALKTFKCVIYKAPLGYRYVKDTVNPLLKKLVKC